MSAEGAVDTVDTTSECNTLHSPDPCNNSLVMTDTERQIKSVVLTQNHRAHDKIPQVTYEVTQNDVT